MMKLNLGNLPVREMKTRKATRRPAWYKAEQEQIDSYTAQLHDKLDNLVAPESLSCSNCQCEDPQHGQERDDFVLDLITAAIETSHQTIPMSGTVRSSQDGNCFVEKTIPGWKEHVEPYRQDAIFWHSIWQSAGRPGQEGLKDFMSKTQNQFH